MALMVWCVRDRVCAQLEVIAQLSRYDPDFLNASILPRVVALFQSRRPLLEMRGSYVIRRLCQLLDPNTIYLSLARILLPMLDVEFVTLFIEILSLLLLTGPELVRSTPLALCSCRFTVLLCLPTAGLLRDADALCVYVHRVALCRSVCGSCFAAASPALRPCRARRRRPRSCPATRPIPSAVVLAPRPSRAVARATPPPRLPS